MRALFADPNRDLLSGYRKLMEAENYTVESAFDGTRVLEPLSTT